MIDLVLLQSISYIAAASGVFAAAIYYIMILRARAREYVPGPAFLPLISISPDMRYV